MRTLKPIRKYSTIRVLTRGIPTWGVSKKMLVIKEPFGDSKKSILINTYTQWNYVVGCLLKLLPPLE